MRGKIRDQPGQLQADMAADIPAGSRRANPVREPWMLWGVLAFARQVREGGLCHWGVKQSS